MRCFTERLILSKTDALMRLFTDLPIYPTTQLLIRRIGISPIRSFAFTYPPKSVVFAHIRRSMTQGVACPSLPESTAPFRGAVSSLDRREMDDASVTGSPWLQSPLGRNGYWYTNSLSCHSSHNG